MAAEEGSDSWFELLHSSLLQGSTPPRDLPITIRRRRPSRSSRSSEGRDQTPVVRVSPLRRSEMLKVAHSSAPKIYEHMEASFQSPYVVVVGGGCDPEADVTPMSREIEFPSGFNTTKIIWRNWRRISAHSDHNGSILTAEFARERDTRTPLHLLLW